jgi:hypothetical protein
MGLDSIEVFTKFQVNKKSTRGSATTPKLRKFPTIKALQGEGLHTTGGLVPGRFPPNQTLRIYGIDVLKDVLDGGMLTLPGYCKAHRSTFPTSQNSALGLEHRTSYTQWIWTERRSGLHEYGPF